VADAQSFCGLRCNVEPIGGLPSVISSLYDIISPEEQKFYHPWSLPFPQNLTPKNIRLGSFSDLKRGFLNGLRSGIIALGLKEVLEEECYVRAFQMVKD
jgi:hypothetical protein